MLTNKAEWLSIHLSWTLAMHEWHHLQQYSLVSMCAKVLTGERYCLIYRFVGWWETHSVFADNHEWRHDGIPTCPILIFTHLWMTYLLGCSVQGSKSIFVCSLDIGPLLQQNRHDIGLSLSSTTQKTIPRVSMALWQVWWKNQLGDQK